MVYPDYIPFIEKEFKVTIIETRETVVTIEFEITDEVQALYLFHAGLNYAYEKYKH